MCRYGDKRRVVVECGSRAGGVRLAFLTRTFFSLSTSSITSSLPLQYYSVGNTRASDLDADQ
jgi:hypothetical protein